MQWFTPALILALTWGTYGSAGKRSLQVRWGCRWNALLHSCSQGQERGAGKKSMSLCQSFGGNTAWGAQREFQNLFSPAWCRCWIQTISYPTVTADWVALIDSWKLILLISSGTKSFQDGQHGWINKCVIFCALSALKVSSSLCVPACCSHCALQMKPGEWICQNVTGQAPGICVWALSSQRKRVH